MYRTGSFASTSQYSLKSANSTEKDVKPGEEDSRVVYLKSKGKLLIKLLKPAIGGRLLTFCNYPIKNRHWNMKIVVCHPMNGAFAIADERGQIFYMPLEKGIYQAVRAASNKVMAMCFLPLQKTHIMIAHENGMNVIVDAFSAEIVSYIQFPISFGAIRLVSAHPKDPVIAVVQGNYTIVLWDIV
jgi:hypothetical protein